MIITYIKNIRERTLKSRQEKASWLGNLEPKESHSGEMAKCFGSFVFCFIYTRFGPKESTKQEPQRTPTNKQKNVPTKPAHTNHKTRERAA